MNEIEQTLSSQEIEIKNLKSELKIIRSLLIELAKRYGVCTSCLFGAPDPWGCTDCLGTGMEGGSDAIEDNKKLKMLVEDLCPALTDEGVADSLFWEEHFSKPKKPTGAT